MTIKVEDAISNLKNQMMRFAEGTEPDLALQMAVKALEQEHILDKIRAEIDTESAKSFGYPNWERAKALEWALSVIDKYTAESEEGAEE